MAITKLTRIVYPQALKVQRSLRKLMESTKGVRQPEFLSGSSKEGFICFPKSESYSHLLAHRSFLQLQSCSELQISIALPLWSLPPSDCHWEMSVLRLDPLIT